MHLSPCTQGLNTHASCPTVTCQDHTNRRAGRLDCIASWAGLLARPSGIPLDGLARRLPGLRPIRALDLAAAPLESIPRLAARLRQWPFAVPRDQMWRLDPRQSVSTGRMPPERKAPPSERRSALRRPRRRSPGGKSRPHLPPWAGRGAGRGAGRAATFIAQRAAKSIARPRHTGLGTSGEQAPCTRPTQDLRLWAPLQNLAWASVTGQRE